MIRDMVVVWPLYKSRLAEFYAVLTTSKSQWPKNNKDLPLTHATSLMGPLKAVSIVLCPGLRMRQQLISGTWLACCGGGKEKKNVGGHILAIKCCNSEVTYWPELFTPHHPPSPPKGSQEVQS